MIYIKRLQCFASGLIKYFVLQKGYEKIKSML